MALRALKRRIARRVFHLLQPPVQPAPVAGETDLPPTASPVAA